MRYALVVACCASLVGCDMAHANSERFPLCLEGQRCPVAGQRCAQTQGLGMRCVPACTSASDCQPTEQCAPVSNVTSGCFPPGPVEPGEPCLHRDDCTGGYVCLGTEDSEIQLPYSSPARCRALCERADAGAVGQCAAGEYCTHTALPLLVEAACIVLCDPATGAGCSADRVCLSGLFCVSAEMIRQCVPVPCALGQICDTGECVDPVTYASTHPPS